MALFFFQKPLDSCLPPLCSGADAIIRQHKAACLRITALLACKDLLWIGTSAGNKLVCRVRVLAVVKDTERLFSCHSAPCQCSSFCLCFSIFSPGFE